MCVADAVALGRISLWARARPGSTQQKIPCSNKKGKFLGKEVLPAVVQWVSECKMAAIAVCTHLKQPGVDYLLCL